MERIDATGKPCPLPVVEAKKALAKPGADGVVIIVDNFTAVQNIEKMAVGLEYGFSYTEIPGSKYSVTLTRNGADPAPDIEDGVLSGLVIAIGRDAMGSGSEELGKILMKAFVYSVTELAPPPSTVVFFNSGAKLTSGSSNTLGDLGKLSASGTKILTCGTCVDYYKLPPPSVGEIADMYEIATLMSAAERLINL